MSEYDAAEAMPADGHAELASELGTAVQRYVESLESLGIQMSRACGEVEIDRQRAQMKIGNLIIRADGTVVAVPRSGTTPHQQLELLALAGRARCSGPDPSAGWREVDRLGWSCAVFQSQ